MPRALRKLLHLKAASKAEKDTYRRVLDTIGLKRRNPAMPVSKAAKSSGTTVRTVRKYARSVLRSKGRHLQVAPRDHLVRPMRMLTPKGEVNVETRDSAVASEISRHQLAIRSYVIAGDQTVLESFTGKSVHCGGKTYDFLTDTAIINRLARAGALHFLDIYASRGLR